MHYQLFDSLCTATERAEEEDRDGSSEKNTDGNFDRRRVVGGGKKIGHRRREFDGFVVGDDCGNELCFHYDSVTFQKVIGTHGWEKTLESK